MKARNASSSSVRLGEVGGGSTDQLRVGQSSVGVTHESGEECQGVSLGGKGRGVGSGRGERVCGVEDGVDSASKSNEDDNVGELGVPGDGGWLRSA